MQRCGERLLVAASGNSRDGEPAYPARYATEAGIEGMMIAVGYHDARGVKDTSANRPGKARDYFICAPGNTSSAATPYVSGSLALILEAFPELTRAKAVAALLAGARDAGDTGPDWIYGRGLLDLEGAFVRAKG